MRKGKNDLIGSHFTINYPRIGKLMAIAIKQRNQRNPKRKKLKERSWKVMKKFAVEYMKAAIREISEQPVAHPFYSDGISHIQVLQKDSKKGYEWDKKYNMRDFEIVMAHEYPYAQVLFGEKTLDKVLENAEKGDIYMEEISGHTKKLFETVKMLKKNVA